MKGMISISDKTQLKYLSSQRARLFYRNSLALLLMLVKQAQDSKCRYNYYLICYFFSVQQKIAERSFWLTQWELWKFSNLCVITDLHDFLCTMECHLNDNIWLDFRPNYFYQKKNDFSLMLKYSDFFLKIDRTAFYILWSGLEFIRMHYYNQYVKNHFFINKSSFKPIRKVLTKKFDRIGIKRSLMIRNHFLMRLADHRYRIVKFFYNQLPLKPAGDYSMAAILLQNKEYNFLKSISSVSLNNLIKKGKNTRYFRTFIRRKMHVMGNHLLACYGNNFLQYNRLDFANSHMLYYMFGMTPWGKYWWNKLWSTIYFKKLLTNFYSSTPVQNFYLISELSKINLSLEFNHTYRFLYYVWFMMINSYLDAKALRYLHWIRFYKDPGSSYAHVIMQRFLADFLITGRYKKINVAFTRSLFLFDYYSWRIWNPETDYKFNEGRFSFDILIRKIDLDHMYQSRLASLSSLYFIFLDKIKLILPQQLPVAHYNWYSLFFEGKEREDRLLKISNILWASALDSLVVSLFSLSLSFSFLSYFVVFKNEKTVIKQYNKYQSGFILMPGLNHATHKRRLKIYKHNWYYLRRYPNKMGIHSNNNPIYLERWLSFFHRMRRSGIPGTELPYYRALESIDFINDLHKLTAAKGYLNLNEKMWIIKDDLSK